MKLKDFTKRLIATHSRCTHDSWRRKNLYNHYHSQQQENFKYFGINLTKIVKDLYNDNCKTLSKQKKMHRQMKIPFSCIGRINIIKMQPKAFCTFAMVLISMPGKFLHRSRKNDAKTHMEAQDPKQLKTSVKVSVVIAMRFTRKANTEAFQSARQCPQCLLTVMNSQLFGSLPLLMSIYLLLPLLFFIYSSFCILLQFCLSLSS